LPHILQFVNFFEIKTQAATRQGPITDSRDMILNMQKLISFIFHLFSIIFYLREAPPLPPAEKSS